MLKLFKYYLPQHIVAIVFSAAFVALLTAVPGFWGVGISVHGGAMAIYFGLYVTLMFVRFERKSPQALVEARLFPVTDGEIVGLRYAVTGLCFLAWLIIVAAVMAFFSVKWASLINGPSPEEYLVYLLDTLIGAGLTYGVALPITYMMVDKKSKLLRYLMYMAAVTPMFSVYVMYLFQILMGEYTFKTIPFLAVMAIAALAFWAASFRLSVKLYRKINM